MTETNAEIDGQGSDGTQVYLPKTNAAGTQLPYLILPRSTEIDSANAEGIREKTKQGKWKYKAKWIFIGIIIGIAIGFFIWGFHY